MTAIPRDADSARINGHDEDERMSLSCGDRGLAGTRETSKSDVLASCEMATGAEWLTEQFERYHRDVYGIAYAELNNADLAEDVVQVTFIRLLKLPELRLVLVNPLHWLLAVARKAAIDIGRSKFRRNGTQSHESMHALPSCESSPIEALEQEEARESIKKKFGQMSKLYQNVWTLHYVEGWSKERIASEIGRSPKAVKGILRRAKARIRKMVP